MADLKARGRTALLYRHHLQVYREAQEVLKAGLNHELGEETSKPERKFRTHSAAQCERDNRCVGHQIGIVRLKTAGETLSSVASGTRQWKHLWVMEHSRAGGRLQRAGGVLLVWTGFCLWRLGRGSWGKLLSACLLIKRQKTINRRKHEEQVQTNLDDSPPNVYIPRIAQDLKD